MGNDITIAYGIIVFFILIGTITPFINDEFGSSYNVNNIDSITNEISSEDGKSSSGAFAVIGSIFGMFFWTFGNIPFFLDLVLLTPLRIILALIVARNIWIGGGG